MDRLAHTHGCVQAWPYEACSYKVWRGIAMPRVLGCNVLACVGYRAWNGLLAGVTQRKQHRPGIGPNDNTTHVPTAGSSAALTKPNHSPTRHPRAKGKIILQMVTPHAA